MNKQPKSRQFNLRTLLLLFVPIALVLLFGVDRYRHAKERREAFTYLANIGLNHEFDSDSSAGNGVFFYSTSSHFDPSSTNEILRNLKTVSKEHNSVFRFGYGVQSIDFKSSEADAKLIEELGTAFPDAEIRIGQANGG